jgi:hypothetical protein
MPFWEQPAPALADWECAGEAISLNGNRPAVNRAARSLNYAAPGGRSGVIDPQICSESLWKKLLYSAADLFNSLRCRAFGRPQWIAKLPAKGALPPCGDTREGKGAQRLCPSAPLASGPFDRPLWPRLGCGALMGIKLIGNLSPASVGLNFVHPPLPISFTRCAVSRACCCGLLIQYRTMASLTTSSPPAACT